MKRLKKGLRLIDRVTDVISQHKECCPYAYLSDKQRSAMQRYTATRSELEKYADAIASDGFSSDARLTNASTVRDFRVAYEASLMELKSKMQIRRKLKMIHEALKHG